ncbi:MAG: hypothetical protein IPK07_24445 [Deltaproteobacteria bacterium]|nr:hypothetical protein [Deltaproteobacteria bacterium]
MLKALFFIALAWLAVAPVRKRANGEPLLALQYLATGWAKAVHPGVDPMFDRLARTWPVLLPVTFLAALSYARASYGVLTGDGFAWIEQARRLDLRDLTTFVHPFYNFGWPGVLRLGLELGYDELTTARVAASCFAVVAVLFACLITRWAAPSRIFVCAGLAIAPVISSYAALGSTDLPAAALQLGAVWFALGRRRCSALAGGLLLGLGFLFRHQSLVLALPLAAIITARHTNRRVRLALFSLGLLAGSAPQLTANTLVTGNPLWSEQSKNVLFGINGGGTIRDWGLFPTGPAPSLLTLLRTPQLLTHWFREIRGVQGLTVTSCVVVASLALPQGRKRRFVLTGLGALYCLPLAVAWIEPRFVLVATAATSFIDGYWIATLAAAVEASLLTLLRLPIPMHRVADLFLVAVVLGNAVRPILAPPADPKASLYDAVSACLSKADVTNPGSVLTFSPVQTDIKQAGQFQRFTTPIASEPNQSIELANNPAITTVLVDEEFLPSDRTLRAAIHAVLASRFRESCSAHSADNELHVAVLTLNAASPRPPAGGPE